MLFIGASFVSAQTLSRRGVFMTTKPEHMKAPQWKSALGRASTCRQRSYRFAMITTSVSRYRMCFAEGETKRFMMSQKKQPIV